MDKTSEVLTTRKSDRHRQRPQAEQARLATAVEHFETLEVLRKRCDSRTLSTNTRYGGG